MSRPVTDAVSARITVSVVALLLIFAGVSACGGEPKRSAQAYCNKHQSGFARIRREHPDIDQYTHSKESPLLMLVSVAAAYGDIVALMGDMAKVAPGEIQTDVQRVHDTLQKQLDSVGDLAKNPIGAIAQQLVTGIATSGAFQRMDAYTLQHCGEHMFSVSPH